jgi:hypothetical protein
MSVLNLPWSDLITHDDELGGSVRPQWTLGDPCRQPGCTRVYGGPGAGRGYCNSHYRTLLRSGSPEGAAVVRWNRLTEAALNYEARASVANVKELLEAAFDQPGLRGIHNDGRRRRPVRMKPAMEESVAVMHAAHAYADCDTGDDAAFLRAREELAKAARAYRDAAAEWVELDAVNEPQAGGDGVAA